jgi:hypothetical protein
VRYTVSCIDRTQITRLFEVARACRYPTAMSEPTVRWALSNADEHVICTERREQARIELRLTYANLTIAALHCKSPEEAARWSEQRRLAWEGYGWKLHPPSAPQLEI